MGVINATKHKIIESVNKEWLEEICDKILGFTNVTPLKMLQHFEDRGGDIDYINIQEMKTKRDGPWDTNQHIVTYFSRVEQAVKRLKEGKVTTSEVKILSNVLFQIKQSGEMEWALKEWNKKPEADRTWKNAKTYFSKEYANRRKHAKIEAKQAGYGSANQAKEQREAETEQEIAALTNKIAQQLKSEQNEEMARFIEQQKQMHEANQKLM